MGRRRKRRVVVPVGHSYYELVPQAPGLGGNLGVTEMGKRKVIRVSDQLNDPHNWALTFWHEYWHAALFELGYHTNDEEAKVEGFAHLMMTLLTDPHGRALLIDMLKALPPKAP